MRVISRVRITPTETLLNDRVVSTSSISGLYREFVDGGYPKFFKMDSLCRLGIVGSELLLREVPQEEKEHAAIVLFNKNGSLVTDRNYQETITEDNYFPSPSLFVYTLANIVTGEIAIRHKIYGESSFYVMSENDPKFIDEIVAGVYAASSPSFVLAGWVDYDDDANYLAELQLVTKQ